MLYLEKLLSFFGGFNKKKKGMRALSEEMYHGIAIALYLALMLLIGWYGYKKTTDLDDYMLGGRGLGALVTALSAGAADMSGWLLMGLPGEIYEVGLGALWIAIGLTIGAYFNWLYVAPRLRVYTQVANNSITIPSFFDNRLRDTSGILRIASGLVILVFFTFYVSSGMVAGGKFFQSSFNLEYHTGVIIVAVVVIAYTLFGGFLAVSYTDAVQGLIMFFALMLVPIVSVFYTGGIPETTSTILEVNPDTLNLLKGVSIFTIISGLAWGLGYFGQPHIIVRFMAITSVKETTKARRIGITWMILCLLGTSLTALIGIAFFAQYTQYTLVDPETVFIDLGQIVFHPFIAGVVLAAVLAAVMSTISSQLIVTSSALVEDLYRKVIRQDASQKHYVFLGRIAVLAVAIVALILAWPNNESILALVAFAWAGFGGAFGPIVILSLYWRKITRIGALAGMVTGAVVVGVWGNIDVLSSTLYEIVPGFILNLIVTIVVSNMTFKQNPEIEKEFDETIAVIERERA